MSNNEMLVVDIGGTKVDLLYTQRNGNIIFKQVKTPNTQDMIKDLRLIFSKFCNGKSLLRIVISFPGLLSKTGEIIKWPNKTYWEGFNLTKELETILDVGTIEVLEDGNAATLSNLIVFGNVNSIFVNVGTGIGSGIMLNGNIYSGSNGFAGEIGHTKVYYNDKDLCNCGQSGCLQLYCSGTAIYSAIKNKKDNELSKAGEILSYGVHNMVKMFDIEKIHIGGTVLDNPHYRKAFLTNLIKNEKLFLQRKLEVIIRPFKNASLTGAFLFALQTLHDEEKNNDITALFNSKSQLITP